MLTSCGIGGGLVSWSRDGRSIATTGIQPPQRIDGLRIGWSEREKLWITFTHKEPPNHLEDVSELFSQLEEVHLRDASEEHLHRFPVHSQIESLEWHPRKDLLATTGRDYVWSGMLFAPESPVILRSRSGGIRFPVGSRISNRLKVFNIRTGSILFDKELTVFDASSNGTFPSAPRWSPDGTLLAIGLGRRLLILDGSTGREVATLQCETQNSVWTSVCWSPDGASIAAAGQPTLGKAGIVVWDVASRKPKFVLFEYAEHIAWSPDGRFIGSVGAAATLWNVETRREMILLSPFAQGTPCRIEYSPDGMKLAVLRGSELRIYPTKGIERWASEVSSIDGRIANFDRVVD